MIRIVLTALAVFATSIILAVAAILPKAIASTPTIASLALAPLDSAHAFKVIYSFTGGTDAENPAAGLVRDAAGNFYGTTGNGGTGNCGNGFACGTVFKLAPDGTETVLHSFTSGTDGAMPGSGRLLRDRAGNLYGTTIRGGGKGNCYFGCGTVFKVAPDGTETVVHAFAGGSDGASPQGGLIKDAAGNLYGTTEYGGTGYRDCTGGYGSGTIFKVAPDGQEKVLHSFTGSPDGCQPFGQLIMDAAGNLYGTTGWGGKSDCPPIYCGTVFKLSPDGTETVLYSFRSHDGEIPEGKLIMDAAGNLYGTTVYGGAQGVGTVFKLAPDGTETVFYSFCGSCSGGHSPYAGLLMDRAGNLYGTTAYGGLANCVNGFGCGTVFKLAPDGTEKVLHAFTGGSDGGGPHGDLITDGAGHLYGTSGYGGKVNANCYYGCGTVFRIKYQ